MMKPTIHRNGTSRDELLDQVCVANEALQHAISELGRAYPNARDYYPQGAGAYKTAMTEFESRCQRLVSVRDELQELAIAISDDC